MSLDTEYEITTDSARFDLTLIDEFLADSYWARDIPRSVVERSIQHSLAFGAFHQGYQVGFARVITDFATFAYIGDLFVVAKHRRRGVAKLLTRAILSHPNLQGLRRLLLATRDAHGLYAQFGFKPLAHPADFMTLHYPNVYQRDAHDSE